MQIELGNCYTILRSFSVMCPSHYFNKLLFELALSDLSRKISARYVGWFAPNGKYYLFNMSTSTGDQYFTVGFANSIDFRLSTMVSSLKLLLLCV